MESLTSISCVGKVMHQEDQLFLTGMEDPICSVFSQFDTMNYDQAMKVADRHKFRQAMLEEIANHFE